MRRAPRRSPPPPPLCRTPRRRAQTRALLYARATGQQVSRIISIAEAGQETGGNPPPMMTFARAKAESATPIQAGERDVTVTLQVRFLLR